MLITHPVSSKNTAPTPTTKDGANAKVEWYTAVEDAKCDINVVA